MLIDFHTHTFPEAIAAAAIPKLEAAACMRARLDGTAAALRASLAEAGIDLAVTLPVATNVRQPHKLNLAALALNEQGGPLLSFGAAHPEDPDWAAELRFCADHGLKGVKLHPMYQGVDFDDIRTVRLVGLAAELGLIVVVHAGEDIGIPGPARCSPENAVRVQRQTGIDRLVLAHMGGWNVWERVRDHLAGAPVYLDTSFSFTRAAPHPLHPVPPEHLRNGDPALLGEIIVKHGTHRVLFGSDSPWGDEAEELAAIRALGLAPEEENAILGGNAARLLGL